jgi:hypothetical protein
MDNDQNETRNNEQQSAEYKKVFTRIRAVLLISGYIRELPITEVLIGGQILRLEI